VLTLKRKVQVYKTLYLEILSLDLALLIVLTLKRKVQVYKTLYPEILSQCQMADNKRLLPEFIQQANF
jgi:hypothetical protein